MTSRERVLRCLEFDRPDRVPRDLWLLPIARLTHGRQAIDDFLARWPRDFAGIQGLSPGVRPLARGDPHAVGEYRDEWGCTFVNIQAGVIGEVKHPLIDDWSKLADFRPPLATLDIDVDAIDRFCANTDSFVIGGCCPRPFERLQFLRGSENLYMDLAEESAEVLELLRVVADFYRREMQSWARTKVDGLMFMDDWGSQRALLISPAQWRRLFKPLYVDYARIAHESGKKLLMHSDGYIFDIYEDLVEIGVDAVNSQLFCMDIEELGRRFAGRITFWGEIDRQHVLTAASVEEVWSAVKRVVDSFYRPEGGIIAQFEFGAGTRLANAHAVFEAWERLCR